jgi:glycosyltransferase involved in cell wall biosynthesis
LPANPTSARPPISAVIPAYNAAALLPRALASIAAQTVQPDEIVVVDDGSADDTSAVAAGYPGLPVRVIRHDPNRGGAAALQTGVEAARHALIAFLDADDEWLPEKLERQLMALAALPEAVAVGTGYRYVDRQGTEYGGFGLVPFAHGPHEFWKNMLGVSALLQSSTLARRDVVLAVGGLDPTLRTGYDQDLFLRMAATGPIAYVHAPLVRYHDAPGSITKLGKPADALKVLHMHEASIAAFADRLSPAERRSMLARRYGEAANDLISARAWHDGLRYAAKAVLGGDPPLPHLIRIAANAPVLRDLRRLTR